MLFELGLVYYYLIYKQPGFTAGKVVPFRVILNILCKNPYVPAVGFRKCNSHIYLFRV